MEQSRLWSPPVHSPHDARWRELLLIGEFSQGDTELSALQDADHTSDLRQSNRPSILRDLGSTHKHAHTQDRRAGKTRTSNAAAIHSPSQSSVPMTRSEYANSRGRFLVQELAIFVTHRLFAGCASNRRVGGGGFVCDPFWDRGYSWSHFRDRGWSCFHCGIVTMQRPTYFPSLKCHVSV